MLTTLCLNTIILSIAQNMTFFVMTAAREVHMFKIWQIDTPEYLTIVISTALSQNDTLDNNTT